MAQRLIQDHLLKPISLTFCQEKPQGFTREMNNISNLFMYYLSLRKYDKIKNGPPIYHRLLVLQYYDTIEYISYEQIQISN